MPNGIHFEIVLSTAWPAVENFEFDGMAGLHALESGDERLRRADSISICSGSKNQDANRCGVKTMTPVCQGGLERVTTGIVDGNRMSMAGCLKRWTTGLPRGRHRKPAL